MKRRSTIGEDPLDAVIPPLPAAGGRERPAGGSAGVRGGRRAGAGSGGAAADERGQRRSTAVAPAAGEGGHWSRGDDPAATAPGQYLTFRAGGDSFAVEILRVREILQPGAFTRVPLAPAWVRGVMNLRGAVLPVVDLVAKLGLGAAEEGRRACIIVVEIGEWEEELVLGVLVDAVSRVVELAEDEIDEPPAFGTPVHLDYLGGMGRLDEEIVLLLDVDRVLSQEELKMAAGLEAAAEGEGEAEGGEGGGEGAGGGGEQPGGAGGAGAP